MSDEAFARRFYSDRAELLALGVPLQSQRDEFTGEELYTLRSEQYFLPQLELEDEELAALQTALYLLEGKFAYAEPLRLALQNLALGRPGFDEAPTETAGRVEVLDPDYSPEMPGRLGEARGRDLEAAHGEVRLLVDLARQESRADAQPVRAPAGQRHLVRRRPRPRPRRHPHLPRLAHPRRDQVRDAPRARLPHAGRLRHRAATAAGRRGRSATSVGEARIEVRGDTAWWVQRAYGSTGHLEDGVFVTDYSSLPMLASWVLRQDGRAVPLEPDELRREVAGVAAPRARRPRGPAAEARRRAAREGRRGRGRPARRPGRAGALRRAPGAARLPARRLRRGEGGGDSRPPRSLERFPDSRGGARGAPVAAQPRQLRRRLLHGLRRAPRRRGARRQGALGRHVPAAAAADAARGAGDPARARVRRADDRRGRAHAARARAPEARGDVRAVRAGADARSRRSSGPRRISSRRSRAACASTRLVEIEYQKEVDAQPSTRLVEPYSLERAAPELVRPHVGPLERRASARSGSTGCAARS